MRVLALEPYYGGSHRSFLDDWISRSEHQWQLLTLPAHHWKWRMRHSAVTFAQQLCDLADQVEWDAIVCSDMLNLAEFRGLCTPAVARLPTVVYFHENQLTYPARFPDRRDLHFAFSNFTTALSADAVWFNSRFHRDQFCDSLREWLGQLPDHQPLASVERIRKSSEIYPPSIDTWPQRRRRASGPLRILWCARWEFDKNPQLFFAAMRQLRSAGIDFRLSILGESFQSVPEEFAAAKIDLREQIDAWGFLPERADYCRVLQEADVYVSTADHEFFGIAAAEAIAAGAFPLLPNKLAYPELVTTNRSLTQPFFHDGSAVDVCDRLVALARRQAAGADLSELAESARAAANRFVHDKQIPHRDEALRSLVTQVRSS